MSRSPQLFSLMRTLALAFIVFSCCSKEGISFRFAISPIRAGNYPTGDSFRAIRSHHFMHPLFAPPRADTLRTNRRRAGATHLFCSTDTMDVVVVGSCNTDLVAYTSRLPQRGETITGSRSEILYGGKGANQAVMASRMGARVAMVACLGDDAFGTSYLDNLAENKIDCGNVRRTGDAATGVAQLCVDESGANFIVVVPGANHHLDPEDVSDAGARLKGCKVMVCQGEVRAETTLKALEVGRAEGMITLFNPAPATENFSNRFLEVSDVVCPNETELATLCKCHVDTSTDKSVHAGARELIARGAKNVIVTLGSRGSMLVSSKSEGYRIFSAEKVSAVDTVGAGDAFMGSLGAYLARGVPLEDAIENAVRVASISVTRAGAQTSYPNASELPPELHLP